MLFSNSIICSHGTEYGFDILELIIKLLAVMISLAFVTLSMQFWLDSSSVKALKSISIGWSKKERNSFLWFSTTLDNIFSILAINPFLYSWVTSCKQVGHKVVSHLLKIAMLLCSTSDLPFCTKFNKYRSLSDNWGFSIFLLTRETSASVSKFL